MINFVYLRLKINWSKVRLNYQKWNLVEFRTGVTRMRVRHMRIRCMRTSDVWKLSYRRGLLKLFGHLLYPKQIFSQPWRYIKTTIKGYKLGIRIKAFTDNNHKVSNLFENNSCQIVFELIFDRRASRDFLAKIFAKISAIFDLVRRPHSKTGT